MQKEMEKRLGRKLSRIEKNLLFSDKGQKCDFTNLELPHRVKDLKELKKLSSNDGRSINVTYQVGTFGKSSKIINYDKDGDVWEILNLIDESEETLTTEELFEMTHIGTALNLECLYYEGC